MGAKSQAQRGMIFAKRDKYGSKVKTPKKWKWIWDEDWENKGKLPNKIKNETVQNVVFKEELTRAKLVNENSGDYPWGARYDSNAPWNEVPDDRINIADINKYGEIELTWRTMLSSEDWEEEHDVIDNDILDEYLAHRLNLNLENYDTQVMTDFEEIENNTYKITASSGDYITVSFEDLANLAN